MNPPSEQPKPTSRSKQNLLIAGGVALCAIFAYFLWPRAAVAPGRISALLQNSTRVQNDAAANVPSAHNPPTLRAGESDWEKLRAKIVALVNGKKVDVCGLSDLDAALFLAEQAEQDGVALIPSQMGKDAANAVLAEASAKLTQSISLHEQAVGLYVLSHQAETAAIEVGINVRNCNGDARCRSDAWQPQPQLRASVAEPLVKMALAGRDPAIYATAMYACSRAPMGACAAISYAG